MPLATLWLPCFTSEAALKIHLMCGQLCIDRDIDLSADPTSTDADCGWTSVCFTGIALESQHPLRVPLEKLYGNEVLPQSYNFESLSDEQTLL